MKPHCLNIVFVIGKYTDSCRRGEGISARGIFHGEDFQWGGKFLGVSFTEKISHQKNL